MSHFMSQGCPHLWKAICCPKVEDAHPRLAYRGGGLLLVKQYTIISQGHTGPHLPHKRTYKVLSTKTRTILWSCIIPPQAGIHST